MYKLTLSKKIDLTWIMYLAAIVFALLNPARQAHAALGDDPATPIVITNCYELMGIGDNPANMNKHYALGNNIDFKADGNCKVDILDADNGAGIKGFRPIGTGLTPSTFIGSFDGRNYTIRNLGMTISTQNFAGLFAELGQGALVKNIVFEYPTINIKGNSQHAGVVAGRVAANAAVQNVHAHVNVVQGTEGNTSSNVGGLIGTNNGLLIKSSADALVSGFGNVGGLVGNNSGTIEECESLGIVNNSIDNVMVHRNLGGVAGYNTGTIRRTFAQVTVEDNKDNPGVWTIGGLVGESLSGRIENTK